MKRLRAGAGLWHNRGTAQRPCWPARLRSDNAQGELYLTDLPGLFLADGLAVGAYRTDDPGAALGVNTPRELAEAERLLRARTGGAL